MVLQPDAYAIGAQVYATVGDKTRRRDVVVGRSFLAGTPSAVHFGLGEAHMVDTLRVVWADGVEETFAGVAADELLIIERAAAVPALSPWSIAAMALSILGIGAVASWHWSG